MELNISSALDKNIIMREVGLREGLQSDRNVLSTERKAQLFKGLVESGFKEINPVAFVNPKKMPQMADAEELLRAIKPYSADIDVSGTVLNEKGLERAMQMKSEGLLQTALFVFSTDQEGMKANGITADTEALLKQVEKCVNLCGNEDMRSVVFISGAFGGSKGPVDERAILDYANRISHFSGISEVLISDSTGQADPVQIYKFLCRLYETLQDVGRIGLHIHDTRGAGMANIAYALASPFKNIVLDSSFGGWGGDYPFVDDSFGNIPSEDLAEMLIGMGFEVKIDVERLMEVTRLYADWTGRPVNSKLLACSGILKWKRQGL